MLQNNVDRSVTVAIATYNSQKHLERLHKCLRLQTDLDSTLKIKVAIYDGGSTDDTRNIATQLGFNVYDNPRGDAISAKSIALNTSDSNYLVFLDHDEFLIEPESIARKVLLIEEYPNVKAVLTEGYVLDSSEHTSNVYASEFGDPVSAFVHRTSSLIRRRKHSFDSRVKPNFDENDFSIYTAKVGNPAVLCELVACGSLIFRPYFVETFEDLDTDPDLVPHLFYLMAARNVGDEFAILKNDPVGHATSTSWSEVIKKIRWRVHNRWSTEDSIAKAGFMGRATLIADARRANSMYSNPNFRTLLFIPYVVLIVPCALDAIRLAFQRRRLGYLMHFPLSVFVVWTSLVTKFKQILGLEINRSRYDGTER